MLIIKPDQSVCLPREIWIPGPKILDLFSQSVHVWKLMLPIQETVKEFFKKNLNSKELKQADDFRFESDRERFIAARGMLKYLITRYLNIENCPTFFYNDYGKPYLREPNLKNLQFNVSHSNNCILIAFSSGIDVGIDVEYYGKPVDIVSVAQEICSNSEFDKLLSCLNGEKILAFYRCWTRKEAVIKAIGKGLSFPVKELEVSFLPHEITQILTFSDPSFKKVSWRLKEIKPEQWYMATVAIKGQYDSLFLWHWHDELIP